MSTCEVAPTESVSSDSVPTDDDTLVLVCSEDDIKSPQSSVMMKPRSEAPRRSFQTPSPADRMRESKRLTSSDRSPLRLRSYRWTSLPPTPIKPFRIVTEAKRAKSLDLKTLSRSVALNSSASAVESQNVRPLSESPKPSTIKRWRRLLKHLIKSQSKRKMQKLKTKMKSLFDAPPRQLLRTPSPSVRYSKIKQNISSSPSDTSSPVPCEYPRISKLSSKSMQTLSSMRRLHQRYLKDKYQLKWRKKQYKAFMKAHFSISSTVPPSVKTLISSLDNSVSNQTIFLNTETQCEKLQNVTLGSSTKSPKPSTSKLRHSVKSQLNVKKKELKSKIESLFDTPPRKRLRSPSPDRSRRSKRLKSSSSSDTTLFLENQSSLGTSELEMSRVKSLAPETQSRYLPQLMTESMALDSLKTFIESQNRTLISPLESKQSSQRSESMITSGLKRNPSELSPSVETLLPMTALSPTEQPPILIRQSESQRGIVMSGSWNVLRNQYLPIPRRLSESALATEPHVSPLSIDVPRLGLTTPSPQPISTTNSELLYSSSSEISFSSLSTRPTGLYQSPLQIEIPSSSAILEPEVYQWPLPTPPCQLTSIPPIQLSSPCDPLLLIPFPSSIDSTDPRPNQGSTQTETLSAVFPKGSQMLSQPFFEVTEPKMNQFSSLTEAQTLQSMSAKLSKLPSPRPQSPSDTRVMSQYELYKLPIRKRALSQFYLPTPMSKSSSDSLIMQTPMRINSPPIAQSKMPASLDLSHIPLPPPQSHIHTRQILSRKRPSVLCSLPCFPQLLERFQPTKQAPTSPALSVPSKSESGSSLFTKESDTEPTASKSLFPKIPKRKRKPSTPQILTRAQKQTRRKCITEKDKIKTSPEASKPHSLRESISTKRKHTKDSSSNARLPPDSTSHSPGLTHSLALKEIQSQLRSLRVVIQRLKPSELSILKTSSSLQSPKPPTRKQMSPAQFQTQKDVKRRQRLQSPMKPQKQTRPQLLTKTVKRQTSTSLSSKSLSQSRTLAVPIQRKASSEGLESEETLSPKSRSPKLTQSPVPIQSLALEDTLLSETQPSFVAEVTQSLAPTPSDTLLSKPKILEHIRLVPMHQVINDYTSNQQSLLPDSWSLIQVPAKLPSPKKASTSPFQTPRSTQSLDSPFDLQTLESLELIETSQKITHSSTKMTQTPTRLPKSKRKPLLVVDQQIRQSQSKTKPKTTKLSSKPAIFQNIQISPVKQMPPDKLTIKQISSHPSVQSNPIKQHSHLEMSASECSALLTCPSTPTLSQFALAVDTLTSALSLLPSETSISIETSFSPSSSTEPIPQQTSPWSSITESTEPIRLPTETSISLLPASPVSQLAHSTEQILEEESDQTSVSMQSLIQLPPETSISLSSLRKPSKPTMKQYSIPTSMPVSHIAASLMMRPSFHSPFRNTSRKLASPADVILESPSQNPSEITPPELTITVKERISYTPSHSTQMKEKELTRRLLATEALISMSSGLPPESLMPQVSLPSDPEIQTQQQTEKELLATEALMLMSSRSTDEHLVFQRKLARRHSTAEALTSMTSESPQLDPLAPITDHSLLLTPSSAKHVQKGILKRRCSTAESLESISGLPSDSLTSNATYSKIAPKEDSLFLTPSSKTPIQIRKFSRRHSMGESCQSMFQCDESDGKSMFSSLPSDSSTSKALQKRKPYQTYPELATPMLTRLQARLLTNIGLSKNPKLFSTNEDSQFLKPPPTNPIQKRISSRRHSTTESLVSSGLPSDSSTTKASQRGKPIETYLELPTPMLTRLQARLLTNIELGNKPKMSSNEESLFTTPSSTRSSMQKRMLTRRHSIAEPLVSKSSDSLSDLSTRISFTLKDKKIATKEHPLFLTPSSKEPIQRRILTRRRSTADSLVSMSSGLPYHSSTSKALQKQKSNKTYPELATPMLTRFRARLSNIELDKNSKILSTEEDSLFLTPSLTVPIQKRILSRRHSTAESLVSMSSGLTSDSSTSKALTPSDKNIAIEEHSLFPTPSSTKPIQKQIPIRRHSTAESLVSPCSVPTILIDESISSGSSCSTKKTTSKRPSSRRQSTTELFPSREHTLSQGTTCVKSLMSLCTQLTSLMLPETLSQSLSPSNPKKSTIPSEPTLPANPTSTSKLSQSSLSYSSKMESAELLQTTQTTIQSESLRTESLTIELSSDESAATDPSICQLPLSSSPLKSSKPIEERMLRQSTSPTAQTLSTSPSESSTPPSPKPSKPKSNNNPIPTFSPESTIQSDQIGVESELSSEPSLPPSSRIVNADGARNLPSG